jgi:hypothetical protein
LFEPAPPGLPGRTALGRLEEVVQRDVEEGTAGLGQDLVSLPQVPVDVEAAASGARDPGADQQLAVDRHRSPVADEDPRRHRREAVPRREQAARLVERGRDKAAVDEPRSALVVLVEAERRLVLGRALARRQWQPEPVRIVAAAPARRVVVRRNLQRLWAWKKFSEPAVAIAADALISSASVAAATICAKR